MRSKYRRRIQRRLIDRKKRRIKSNFNVEERMNEAKMNMELKDYNSVA